MKWNAFTIWAFLICLLGAATTLLPWYRVTIFGDTAVMTGLDAWQGKAAISLFGAAGMLIMITASRGAAPRWRPPCLIAAGVTAAVVIGHYLALAQFGQRKPMRIEIRADGDIAKSLTPDMIRSITSALDIGAPADLVLALGLIVLGVVEWRARGRTMFQAVKDCQPVRSRPL